MNAIAKFTFASLKANRVRTLVTIAGVALAAALLTAVLTTYTSLTHYLYESEAALAGTWTTLAQEADSPELHRQIDEARKAPEVEALATVQDIGFGELTSEQQNKFGYYLPIQNIAGDVEDACAIYPSDGRMPERAGEVMLWENWRDGANVQLGDTLTLQVGQRRAVFDSEAAAAKEAERAAELDELAARGFPVNEEEYAHGEYGDVLVNDEPAVLEDGEILDSRMGYLSAELYNDSYNEELVDVHERTFTVVGFYERGNYALSSSMGFAAVTVDDPEATGLMSVYLTMTDAANQAELTERAEGLFPEADIILHTSMLRFLGIGGSGYIWDTFFGLASVLAVVIVVACVSLIYNAFAISVAERTSQFGLLSSIGASKRQIRRSVLLEALVVACIGIPLGVLVGLGGCAVTFAFIGPMIAAVLGDMGVPFDVSPTAWALIFSCGLTLVTVLVSAFIPALRASHKNIIDALRWTTGGQVSKKGKRLAARGTNPTRLWKHGFGLSRALGAGGMLAHINGKRGATKGRAAAVSLTLAIALLMTAGSLSVFLGYLTDAADVGPDYDIELVSGSTEAHATNLGVFADPEVMGELESVYEDAAVSSETNMLGWTVYTNMPAVLPEDMVNLDMENSRYRQNSIARVYGEGEDSYGAAARINFIDDVLFDKYAQEIGQNPAAFDDPTHPRAIGMSVVYGNSGERYEMRKVLDSPGTVKLYSGGEYRGAPIYDFAAQWGATDDDVWEREREEGTVSIEFEPSFFRDRVVESVSMDEPGLSIASTTVEVVALADHLPPMVQENGRIQFVMPCSLLAAFTGATVWANSLGAYDVREGSSSQSADLIQEAADAHIIKTDMGQLTFFTNDYAAMQSGNKALATIVRVFCLLFTVILALIAMANVFNTVTNSLILRRREFAVMRSIGLSNKQFRRMIAGECTGFALVGLVAGMVIAVGVAYLVYRMVTQSIDGIPFMLPWSYVALAIAMTAAAMAISVAYAMHRCKADNVVEALRMEAI